MNNQKITIIEIRVDEGGELDHSTDFVKLLQQNNILMKTMGGYNSWLNGKIERPHQNITHLINSALRDTGHKRINGVFHSRLSWKYIMVYYIQQHRNNPSFHGISNVQVYMIIKYGVEKSSVRIIYATHLMIKSLKVTLWVIPPVALSSYGGIQRQKK